MSILVAEISGTVGSFSLDAELRVGPEPVALIGPNGAGKTTLLKMLLGVYRPDAGLVRVGAQTLFEASEQVDLPPEQRRLGYVPQEYGLFPHLSVAANVAFGMSAAGRPAADIARRTDDLLERLDLLDLGERRPRTLSGGERQRVALARALAIEPRALLLDEPLAALDRTTRRRTREYLREHLAEFGLPTIIVTHDPADADALAGHVVALEDGRVVQSDALAQARRAPATAFLEDFFG